jgi:hypothetical protein
MGLKSRQNQCYNYTSATFLSNAWCQIEKHKFVMSCTDLSTSENLYSQLEYEVHLSPYLLHVLSYPSWFDNLNLIWWMLQIVKYLIIQISPQFPSS